MEKTTSISSLPVNPNIPPVTSSESENNIQISESSIKMDKNIHPVSEEKKVRFEDDVSELTINQNVSEKPKNTFVINDTHKLVILSGILFFIFIDVKFKKYIVNILTQIFGNFLKTDTGGTSIFGNGFYAVTYSICLYLFTRFIDFTALNLSI